MNTSSENNYVSLCEYASILSKVLSGSEIEALYYILDRTDILEEDDYDYMTSLTRLTVFYSNKTGLWKICLSSGLLFIVIDKDPIAAYNLCFKIDLV